MMWTSVVLLYNFSSKKQQHNNNNKILAMDYVLDSLEFLFLHDDSMISFSQKRNECIIYLYLQLLTVKTQMKCHIIRHFIRVDSVC